MFLKVATFIYKLYIDMTLFKHELLLHGLKGTFTYKFTLIWLYSSMNCCYMFLKVATWIYKLYTDMTSFKYELSLHVFKGSNFYLQIIHWYDFIQVCDKDSTIKDNRSKDNSCFEEFTLWILIKHMNVQLRITLLFWLCGKDSTVKWSKRKSGKCLKVSHLDH